MNTAAAGRRASRRGHVAAGVAACALLLAACSSNKDAVKPTPLAEIRGAIPVRTVWRASLPKAPDAFMQPAVTDDAVYAAGGDGTIVRLDPSSGRVVWRVDAKSPLSAGVGSDGTTVAVATAKGEVLAYGSDGKPRWKAQVASDVVVPPLVGRGLVVVRSTDHRISAFSSDSGKREWMYQRQTPPLSLRVSTPLVFDGDNVVGGFPGGRLVAVSLANGAMRWEATVSEPNGATEVERLADVTGSIAVGARDLCAASYQGRVMCIDATGTGERWARTLAAGAGVAFDDQRVFAVDQASAVVAYTRDAGASVWRTSALANRRLSSPLAQGRWVAVGDLEGYVHFLAAADGALIARAKTDGTAIVAAPQALADGVVVQTRDGSVELLVPGAR
ncbi:MAG TPA: outer membrane protein assembly factor BamB [Burkholderiaceae bacterium]|nr:outer membrane protein assembly factor BamB [Burkholderiaceae bacterium]